jgi:acyl-CoA synthetase (AMP-forming)/AMP-acid ligase II
MALTCGDLIKRGSALYGTQAALLFEGRQFTFAEQAARMFRLANALLGNGLKKQERVAVLARNCSEYIEIFGACEIAGFVAINLNVRLSDAELATICQDSQPSAMICSKDFLAQARALAAQLSTPPRIAIGSETPTP